MRPIGLEIGGHRGADCHPGATETVGEDGAFQHIDGDTRRLVGKVHHLAFTLMEPFDQRFRGFDHRGRECQHCLARE